LIRARFIKFPEPFETILESGFLQLEGDCRFFYEIIVNLEDGRQILFEP
jgi:hypothetical protein